MAFTGYHISQRSFGISVLDDGRVLATGGANGNDTLGTSGSGWDLLTWADPNLSQVSGTLPEARAAHAQTSMSGGVALISGGWTVAGTALATSRLFDSSSLSWISAANMNQARMHHQLVGSGQPLAIGGQTNDVPTRVLNTCELYHSLGNVWTKTGNMTFARTQFGAVALPGRRVLVVGGYGYNPTRTNVVVSLGSCEIYDPVTELWSNLPDMPSGPRIAPIVEYLEAQNVVLVAGGGSVEIDVLDLTTMRWRKSRAAMTSNRSFSAGAIASDDTFLISGGVSSNATSKTNDVVIPGSDEFWLGAGLNDHFRVDEVPDATHIVVNTTKYDYGRTYNVARPGATITPKAALAGPTGIPGPFSYDPKTGFAITAVASTTDQAFNRGGHYASLHLVPTFADPTPALNFPDEEGFLVLQFGYENVIGPIRYFGRLTDEDLILDAGSPFLEVLPAGATVRLLSSRLPFEPASGALVGSFYATGTAAGRVAAQQTINDIVAAGKQILVSIIYPGDRGLGAAGYPQKSDYKLSDKVAVWGGDDLDQEIPAARKGQ